MKVLYELGRMATRQSAKNALPEPEGLRELLRRGFAQMGPDGHYELSSRGKLCAERARTFIEKIS